MFRGQTQGGLSEDWTALSASVVLLAEKDLKSTAAEEGERSPTGREGFQ